MNTSSTASSTLAGTDPYIILGVGNGASNAEIKRRYKEMAKKYHPDLNTEDPQASDKMAKVTNAYDFLMD